MNDFDLPVILPNTISDDPAVVLLRRVVQFQTQPCPASLRIFAEVDILRDGPAHALIHGCKS